MYLGLFSKLDVLFTACGLASIDVLKAVLAAGPPPPKMGYPHLLSDAFFCPFENGNTEAYQVRGYHNPNPN